MPEMHFTVRWPDGSTRRCYSPSLVIKDFFAPGADYPLPDFVERSRAAYGISSERVRAKYGWGCAHAAVELSEIEDLAGRFEEQPGAQVRVESFEE